MKRQVLTVSLLMTLGAITAFGNSGNVNFNRNNTNNYLANSNNRLNVNNKNNSNNTRNDENNLNVANNRNNNN